MLCNGLNMVENKAQGFQMITGVHSTFNADEWIHSVIKITSLHAN